jgi:hypothetical protein
VLQLFTIEDEETRREAYFELIARMDGPQLREIVEGIEQAIASEDEQMQEQLGELFDDFGDALMLFDRWAELDPDGVADSVINAPSSSDDDEDEFVIFRAISLAFLARRDPDRATEIAAGVDFDMGFFGNDLTKIVGFGIGLGDPARGVREMATLDEGGGPDLDDLFEAVGSRAGEALPELLNLPTGDPREEALGDLFDAWGEAAPDAALAAARGLADAEERDQAIGRVLEQLAETEPRAAIAEALTLADADRREDVLFDIAETWAEREPAASLQWLAENVGDEAVAELIERDSESLPPDIAMRTIMDLSPEARAEFVRSSDFSESDHFIQRIATADTVEALTWLSDIGAMDAIADSGSQFGGRAAHLGIEHVDEALGQIPIGQFRQSFVREAAEELARTDPESAAAWAYNLSGPDQTHALALAYTTWGETEPETALAHMEETGIGPSVLPSMTDLVVRNWASREPDAAYRWMFEQNGADPEALGAAVEHSGLIPLWVRQDPAAAADAMLGFPEDLAPAHLGTVIENWAAHEPSRASAYINEQLEAGPARDAAVASLVRRIAENDPQGAADWTATIDDPPLRASLLGE